MTGKHAETKQYPYETWGERPEQKYGRTTTGHTVPVGPPLAPETDTTPVEAPHNKPDLAMAYILWFFMGLFGIHRIYIDPASKSGFVMAIMTLSLVGLPVTLVWWVVDLFLTPSNVRESTR